MKYSDMHHNSNTDLHTHTHRCIVNIDDVYVDTRYRGHNVKSYSWSQYQIMGIVSRARVNRVSLGLGLGELY